MAVYTDVGDAEIAAFAAAYDIGRVISLKGIAEGVENTNYALTTDRGAYVLTLYERRTAAQDLPYFLGLMEHLAAAGLPCPTPVRGRDGECLRTLKGRPAAVLTWLGGLWPRDPGPAHCRAVGAALARVHRAGQGYAMTRANTLSLTAWPGLLAQARAVADGFDDGLADRAEATLEVLAAAWPKDLPRGHIHGDLFPDNVFFTDGRITGLIDFYFACEDDFAYDLAVTLNAWAFAADGSVLRGHARALADGYESVRPLCAAERAALPVLCRGAAMRFFLTRLFDWANTPDGALVVRRDPMEYWRRAQFHAGVRDVGDYGLTP
jgi:homoserine kinase type II